MARTIQEIKQELTSVFIEDPVIRSAYNLTDEATFEEEFSKVSLESILFYCIAYSIFILEQLIDVHKKEVTESLSLLIPHTPRWYQSKCKAFLYGFDLLEDSDQFDTSAATVEQINSSKIIKYASVTESTTESRLIIKVAKEENSNPSPLTSQEKLSFEAYISEIKDAGVRTTVISYLPDLLELNLQIYVNPLLIDSQGNSILDGGRPVEDAIQNYLKNLPFNGELILVKLIDAIQSVEGVEIPHLVTASSSWIDPSTNSYGASIPIQIKTIAQSGYFKVDNFNTITYVV